MPSGFRPKSESRPNSRRSTIIVMRATLHDHALNPYYGQWLREKAAVCGPKSPAIAHNEVIASAQIRDL
jgi:hypothetical protein